MVVAIDEEDAGLSTRPCTLNDSVPDLPSLVLAVADDLASCSLPLVQVPVPLLVVVRIRGIRKASLPITVTLHRIHKGIADTYADVGVGDLTHLTLAVDEVQDVRVPVVEDQHQRSAAGPPLFNQAGDKAKEPAPAHRSTGSAIDALHIAVSWPQRGDVHPHPATAAHDLSHLSQ